ncbi:hypothetical protein IKG16_01360 [Candidatus Saccharibacteria bacterium]|nr:hypothetical protein [Candidatus Saccharibacteria bacterium]
MDDFQKLVYTRLQTLPKGYTISIGDFGDISKEEALDHIVENDKIGKVLIQIDREYFDSLKSGEFYNDINN